MAESLPARERGNLKRRPASGGYARGDEKRERIIEAALRCFGEDGYLGASTRRIAQEAGVNPPAIQYYFDGKEGLYRACGDHVVARFRAALQQAYAAAAAATEPDSAMAALLDLVETVVDFLLGTVEEDGWAPFLARSQAKEDSGPKNEEAGQELQQELHDACIRLVSLILGRSAADPEIVFRGFMVMGQMSIFFLSREAVLARLGWTRLDGAHLGRLKALLRLHTQAALAV